MLKMSRDGKLVDTLSSLAEGHGWIIFPYPFRENWAFPKVSLHWSHLRWLILCINLTGSRGAQIRNDFWMHHRGCLQMRLAFTLVDWLKQIVLTVDDFIWSVEGLNGTTCWGRKNSLPLLFFPCFSTWIGTSRLMFCPWTWIYTIGFLSFQAVNLDWITPSTFLDFCRWQILKLVTYQIT